ncbi:hypothetical protein [Lysobacter brunescens]|uniref:Lipoprotein n=1 Tax=Lysobacter brunescens TaxID=262323 RepID=A0ABW2Y7A3_9GAMM
MHRHTCRHAGVAGTPAPSVGATAKCLFAVALAFSAVACTDSTSPDTSAAASGATTADAAASAPAEHPVPSGEPPADVVRDLIFEEYAELEKAGPMPATVTASGQPLKLRAKLFDARKETCSPRPQQPPGHYECTLTIKLSLTGDGSDPAREEPSEQGARLGVKWDAVSGRWIRG